MEFTGLMLGFIAVICGVLALIGMKHETLFVIITIVAAITSYLCFCELDRKVKRNKIF